MKKTLKDLIKLLLPLSAEKRGALQLAAPYLDEEERRLLRYYLKIDRAFFTPQRFGTTPALFEDKEWPLFKSHLQESEVDQLLERVNGKVTSKAKEEAFIAFAPVALQRVSERIAPNIIGMDDIKSAVALQLFAKEPVHIMLIGDPGTGKTDILRGVATFAPIGSFGLGSGTSGVGLSAAVKGDQLIKGLLPLADGGIACIDELNLMKPKDMASLYNAMEKGFITYDKGGTHEQLPAHVRVCATANPADDTFVGKSVEILKKQLPFDDALLSRFHLLFVVRKPTPEEFEEITRHIVATDADKSKGAKRLSKEDIAFVKEYITRSETIDVELDERFQAEIAAFIRSLKEDERRFLVEIGPRAVVGVVRLVKAMARSELAEAVDGKHLERSFAIVRSALYVRKAEGQDGHPQGRKQDPPREPPQERPQARQRDRRQDADEERDADEDGQR